MSIIKSQRDRVWLVRLRSTSTVSTAVVWCRSRVCQSSSSLILAHSLHGLNFSRGCLVLRNIPEGRLPCSTSVLTPWCVIEANTRTPTAWDSVSTESQSLSGQPIAFGVASIPSQGLRSFRSSSSASGTHHYPPPPSPTASSSSPSGYHSPGLPKSCPGCL